MSGLDDLRERLVDAYASGDAERASDLYVDEAVQQPPGQPAIVGRPAIRDAYGRLFAHGGLSLSLNPWESSAVGGEARERGSYRLAAGDQVLLAGKYLVIARPDTNGEWRYVWTTVAPD